MEIKNKKRICIIIISVLICIVIIFSILNLKKSNKNLPSETGDDLSNTEFNQIDSSLKKVDIRNNYYIVKNCVLKFLMAVGEFNNIEEQFNIDYIYSLLDEEYINFKEIDKENVIDKIKNIYNIGNEENTTITIEDMYVSQRSFDISVYFVYGKIKVNSDVSKFSIMVKVDRTNETFKVLLEDYIKKEYSDIKIGKNIEISTSENINNEMYNIYEYANVSNDTYASDLFSQIKYYIMNDNEKLYSILEKDYKKNYHDYQEFYDYITSIYLKLLRISYGTYEKQLENDSNTVYMLFDKDETFVFNVYENNPFDYTVSIEKLR